jgi:hypothetical protein
VKGVPGIAILLVAGIALAASATVARGSDPPAAASSIGLTRQEAIEDAEQVLRDLWPQAWKHHHETRHCKKGGKRIVCPPVYFNNRISLEEIKLVYGLIRSSHPYSEISGWVYIHSASSNENAEFGYTVERCTTHPPGCRVVAGNQ